MFIKFSIALEGILVSFTCSIPITNDSSLICAELFTCDLWTMLEIDTSLLVCRDHMTA
jgi:hypothetical protein